MLFDVRAVFDVSELSKRATSGSTPTLNLELLNFEPAVILQPLERSEAVERLERFELSGVQLSGVLR